MEDDDMLATVRGERDALLEAMKRIYHLPDGCFYEAQSIASHFVGRNAVPLLKGK